MASPILRGGYVISSLEDRTMCLTPRDRRHIGPVTVWNIPFPTDHNQTKSYGQYHLWRRAPQRSNAAAEHNRPRKRRQRQELRPQIGGLVPLTDLPRHAEVEVSDVEGNRTNSVARTLPLCAQSKRSLSRQRQSTRPQRWPIDPPAAFLPLVDGRRWTGLPLVRGDDRGARIATPMVGV